MTHSLNDNPSIIQRLRQKAAKMHQEIYALWYAYRDPRTPWYARIFAALVLGYAFSPIDLIPDFIPVLGMLDDLLLVPLGISLAIKMIPGPVMMDARNSAELQLQKEKHKSWTAAAIIVLIWLLILFFVFRLILGAVSG